VLPGGLFDGTTRGTTSPTVSISQAMDAMRHSKQLSTDSRHFKHFLPHFFTILGYLLMILATLVEDYFVFLKQETEMKN
jgi:hypothetical protein